MKVVVSACLLGHNCKYNGKNNRNETLLAFLQDKEVIPVCPEAVLPRPRRPVEWLQGRAVTDDGCDGGVYQRSSYCSAVRSEKPAGFGDFTGQESKLRGELHL